MIRAFIKIGLLVIALAVLGLALLGKTAVDPGGELWPGPDDQTPVGDPPTPITPGLGSTDPGQGRTVSPGPVGNDQIVNDPQGPGPAEAQPLSPAPTTPRPEWLDQPDYANEAIEKDVDETLAYIAEINQIIRDKLDDQ